MLLKENMTDKKQEVVELYKIAVDMADKVSQRRGIMNHFYLTLVSVLLTGSFISFMKEPVISFFLLTLIIIICWLWYKNVLSYKKLNTAKFKVIHQIEKNLSVQIFEDEYNYYKDQRDDFSDIEKKVPLVFIGISVLSLLFLVIKNIGVCN